MHGDVKGSNVMLTAYDRNGQQTHHLDEKLYRYKAKLIDFGSAQRCDQVKQLLGSQASGHSSAGWLRRVIDFCR